MIDDPAKLGRYVDAHVDVICNALWLHAERQNAGADAAAAEYRRGRIDPAVRAEQDASLVTHNGYRASALMLRDDAHRALAVLRELRAMTDDDEPEHDDDDRPDNWPDHEEAPA